MPAPAAAPTANCGGSSATATANATAAQLSTTPPMNAPPAPPLTPGYPPDREGSLALPGEEKDPGDEMKKRIIEYSPQVRT